MNTWYDPAVYGRTMVVSSTRTLHVAGSWSLPTMTNTNSQGNAWRESADTTKWISTPCSMFILGISSKTQRRLIPNATDPIENQMSLHRRDPSIGKHRRESFDAAITGPIHVGELPLAGGCMSLTRKLDAACFDINVPKLIDNGSQDIVPTRILLSSLKRKHCGATPNSSCRRISRIANYCGTVKPERA